MSDKPLFPGADDVAAEGDAVLRRAESEAVAIAGEVGVGVAGEQVNLLAVRTQCETVVGARRGVEVRFGEDEVAARRQDGVVRDAVFHRCFGIVRQEPAADVHGRRGGIVELD